MEKDYNKLLRLTLEIEGLLSLLEHGESGSPENAELLLTEKVSALAAAFKVPVETSNNLLADNDAPVEADPFDADEEETAADAFESAGNALSEPTKEPAEEPSKVIKEKVSVEDEPERPNLDVDEFDTLEFIDEDEEVTTTSRKMKLDEKLAIDSSRDIRRAFTLNDRFRFRRELFENSEARFVDALDVISAMNSYDEAEEYFYDDLCWNPESDDVKDFMQIVYNHFR